MSAKAREYPKEIPNEFEGTRIRAYRAPRTTKQNLNKLEHIQERHTVTVTVEWHITPS